MGEFGHDLEDGFVFVLGVSVGRLLTRAFLVVWRLDSANLLAVVERARDLTCSILNK